jgi:hypothetical protein
MYLILRATETPSLLKSNVLCTLLDPKGTVHPLMLYTDVRQQITLPGTVFTCKERCATKFCESRHFQTLHAPSPGLESIARSLVFKVESFWLYASDETCGALAILRNEAASVVREDADCRPPLYRGDYWSYRYKQVPPSIVYLQTGRCAVGTFLIWTWRDAFFYKSVKKE